TPNRPVFSLGAEPSPVNKEHLKEFTVDELHALLRPHFSRVEVVGQRFKDPALLDAWKDDVREKIRLCDRGTRWQTAPPLRSRLRRLGVVNTLYQVGPLRRAWKALRWTLIGGLEQQLARGRRPYGSDDFEFRPDGLSDAVWLCAILRP